tara:strand:+ start:6655 stop:6780 length:126 start_codon:yes stop_codon:yes gene_type:complete
MWFQNGGRLLEKPSKKKEKVVVKYYVRDIPKTWQIGFIKAL